MRLCEIGELCVYFGLREGPGVAFEILALVLLVEVRAEVSAQALVRHVD
jgi:hypothetical protein